MARRRPRFSGPERGSELTSSWPGKGSAQPRRGDESGPSVLGAAEAPEERRRGWGQEGAAGGGVSAAERRGPEAAVGTRAPRVAAPWPWAGAGGPRPQQAAAGRAAPLSTPALTAAVKSAPRTLCPLSRLLTPFQGSSSQALSPDPRQQFSC